MTVNTLQKVLSHSGLSFAWEELFRNTKPLSRQTVGVDGVSIKDFDARHKPLLLKLAERVESNRFEFHELKPTLIQKTNGNDRLICVPTVEDRIVQRALLEFLSCRYHLKLANSISYGFIKDRSVKEAAEVACKYRGSMPWVFKTDITSFFDSIDRKILGSALVKIVRERSLHPLLLSAMNCEVAASKGEKKKRIARLGIKAGMGLRQGMPLSPFFSNLLLAHFDAKVIKTGYSAVRYADDLIFFAESEAECVRIAEFCHAEFAHLGLAIPPLGLPGGKSVIYAPAEPAEFLGLELAPTGGRYELRLSSKQVDRLRNEMLNYGSIKELLSRKITLKTLGSVLSAKRNGYVAAYDVCTNIEFVESELRALERKCLLRIYQNELKMELSSLGAEAHTFLGL